MKTVRIGTRTSELALWQTRQVVNLLESEGYSTEIVPITSSGDRSMGGDLSTSVGQFIHALDKELVNGTIDLAVHSSKDVPVDTHPQLTNLAYLKRGTTADVLLFNRTSDETSLSGLLQSDATTAVNDAFARFLRGSTVGTVSGRRQSFMLSQRPDLVPLAVRGRVETRLSRLKEGRVDGLILAEVGLQRLHDSGVLAPWMLDLGAYRLDESQWPTAPGQGAISVHCRIDEATQFAPLRALLNDKPTEKDVCEERRLLRDVGGGCLYPAGILVSGQNLTLKIAPQEWRAVFCQGRAFPLTHFAGLVEDAVFALPEIPESASVNLDETRKIVSTLNSDRLSTVLQNRGIPVLNQPVVQLKPQPDAWPQDFLPSSSQRSQWPYLVLTSPFAARCAVEVAKTNQDIQRIQWLAIGEGTARACFRQGVTVSMSAQARNSEALAAFIIEKIPLDIPLLIPRSNLAPAFLVDALTSHGYDVTSWEGYQNQPLSIDSAPVDQQDVLLVSSPSSAEAWVENGLPVPESILCMGAATKERLTGLPEFSKSTIEVLQGPTADFIAAWWDDRMRP